MRRTKIVCTLGPSTDKEEVLRNLMKNGMNVARMNFSHGTHEEQKARLDMIKKLREELNLPVAALLDTKGPEIRIGDVEGGKLELKPGQEFTLTTEEMLGQLLPCSQLETLEGDVLSFVASSFCDKLAFSLYFVILVEIFFLISSLSIFI